MAFVSHQKSDGTGAEVHKTRGGDRTALKKTARASGRHDLPCDLACPTASTEQELKFEAHQYFTTTVPVKTFQTPPNGARKALNGGILKGCVQALNLSFRYLGPTIWRSSSTCGPPPLRQQQPAVPEIDYPERGPKETDSKSVPTLVPKDPLKPCTLKPTALILRAGVKHGCWPSEKNVARPGGIRKVLV